jgi:hypothetical protein
MSERVLFVIYNSKSDSDVDPILQLYLYTGMSYQME